jgi:hypothetical protein
MDRATIGGVWLCDADLLAGSLRRFLAAFCRVLFHFSHMPRSRTCAPKDTSASIGFEAKFWLVLYKDRIYDASIGSDDKFVQSEKFVEAYGGKLGDISIYGLESNATARRLVVMNLALAA